MLWIASRVVYALGYYSGGEYCPLQKLAHATNSDFLALKIEHFQLKNFGIFLIFAQNIDCGYTLELPH